MGIVSVGPGHGSVARSACGSEDGRDHRPGAYTALLARYHTAAPPPTGNGRTTHGDERLAGVPTEGGRP